MRPVPQDSNGNVHLCTTSFSHPNVKLIATYSHELHDTSPPLE